MFWTVFFVIYCIWTSNPAVPIYCIWTGARLKRFIIYGLRIVVGLLLMKVRFKLDEATSADSFIGRKVLVRTLCINGRWFISIYIARSVPKKKGQWFQGVTEKRIPFPHTHSPKIPYNSTTLQGTLFDDWQVGLSLRGGCDSSLHSGAIFGSKSCS